MGKKWRAALTEEHGEIITTSTTLATKLAGLARNIRKTIKEVLKSETERGVLTQLLNTFRETLIHDLDEDAFADLYAQTITYGLLSARITNPTGQIADDVISTMPVTNPFLKELIETFLEIGGRKTTRLKKSRIDFDQLGVNEVVELLDAANIEAIVGDFRDQHPEGDPVIHFYEHFLAAYDAKTRMRRGVFYTPRPVVSYIVRSVDELLRTEFELEDGLADTTTWDEMAKRFNDLQIPDGTTPDQAFVQILDPATGTGTFLVEVIDLIHKTVIAKWQAKGHGRKQLDQLWNEYVPEHLLPRLHGYELMMTPYAIAHMKIGLKLYETGYRFESNERAHVYLTNALEPAQDFSDTPTFAIPALAHEAQSVNQIKEHVSFTVCLGNPPYAGHSSHENRWIHDLLHSELPDGSGSYFEADGHPLGERNPKWLNDEYVKFIRLAQLQIAKTRIGINGYITNHGYLTNATFRGMRQSLLVTYPNIRVIDLHGNVKKSERTPNGGVDENVFEIQQGVSIGLFSRPPGSKRFRRVNRSDLWGFRTDKYTALHTCALNEMPFVEITPRSPLYSFSSNQSDPDNYSAAWKLIDVMPVNSVGITTGRDAIALSFTLAEMRERIQRFIDPTVSDEEIRKEFFSGPRRGQRPKANTLARGDTAKWKLSEVRLELANKHDLNKHVVRCLYRPFDFRYLWLHPRIIERSRTQVMKYLDGKNNMGVIVSRMTGTAPFRDAFVSRVPIEFGVLAMRVSNASPVCPLYLLDDQSTPLISAAKPNIAPHAAKAMAACTGLSWIPKGRGNLVAQGTIGPDDLFYYLYAQLFSPQYRSRYESFLQEDHPRVFFSQDIPLIRSLTSFGADLVSLHLMESDEMRAQNIRYIGPDEPLVEVVAWSRETVWLDKNRTVGFPGVSDDVWNFHVGGYQICNKWLKERKGRNLSEDDIGHYQDIIVALSKTIGIMSQIDETIEAHGGWPEAFNNPPSALTR